MHHKRGRARRSRAGCKLCKPWKINGVRNEGLEGERFSDHRRRVGWDIGEIELAAEKVAWMSFPNERDA